MNRFTPKHHVLDKRAADFAGGRPAVRLLDLTIISLALFMTGIVGCSELMTAPAPRSRSEGATPLRLANVAPDMAFDEGINTLKQYFNTVNASPENGRIESRMVEYDQKGGTGRIRDETLKYKNRMRRKATLWIDDSDTGVVARCQVRVQRLDTSDHRFFRPHNEFDDIPNSTPIDRDAGISTDQKEEWTEMPRDVAFERELLRVLSSRLNTTAKG